MEKLAWASLRSRTSVLLGRSHPTKCLHTEKKHLHSQFWDLSFRGSVSFGSLNPEAGFKVFI